MIIPEFIDLTNWAASLIIDFPADDIPLLYNVNDWRDWGDQLSQCDSFMSNNAPGTATFTEWKEWAQAVFFAMNDF